MDRDKFPSSHWFLITQTQKIGISQEAATGDDTYVQSHKPFTPLYITPSTAPSPRKGETLIQSLVLRFWYVLYRKCFLFQSVLPRDSSSVNIYL